MGDARPQKARPSRRRVLAQGILLCGVAGAAWAGFRWSGFRFKVLAPPPTVLPADCEAASGASEVFVAAEGAKYWNRITKRLPQQAALPSGMTCNFVLVPHQEKHNLPSFYIMENKVWNELFSEFDNQHLRAHPDLANTDQWPTDWTERGADRNHGEDMPAAAFPRHPVMRVGYHQAAEFAKWLGGTLPSPQQWDAAAGLYLAAAQKGGAVGPFRGVWNSGPRPKIAIDSAGAGTAPVGSADDDISPFLCRDMAGNGAEWTSEVSSGGYSTVTLRGRDYHKERPLLFSDLLDVNSTEIEKEDPYYTSDHIGFRVVLETR
jgi:hypothetical protein